MQPTRLNVSARTKAKVVIGIIVHQVVYIPIHKVYTRENSETHSDNKESLGHNNISATSSTGFLPETKMVKGVDPWKGYFIQHLTKCAHGFV